MRILDAAEIARLLPMLDAIDVVAGAFTAISRHEGRFPRRTHVPLAHGDALVMPGYDGSAYFGTKLVTVHPQNAAEGKPGTRATYMLIDARDGEPLLLCDGTALTALRTGAASGLATRRLARPDAKTLAIFGAGTQAKSQLAAMLAVRAIEEVRQVRRDADAATRAKAIAGADVIVTATNAELPVFDGRAVEAGTHVNAIGSYRPQMRELDAELLGRARIVVDEREAALAESGELIDGIARGAIASAKIAELGELENDARRDPLEITVFKSVGHAALDLFVAIELAKRAES